jgi:hypothetical protein
MHDDEGDGGQSTLVRRRMDPHTPEQACTTYRPETWEESPGSHCVPASQPGLATTPKLTGGHDVARGPERIDGFALRPAWTSQLESVVAGADGGEVLSRPRAGRRLVGCHYRPVLFW